MLAIDRLRYRTRKGEVATNILNVCDMNGDFVFVLVGCEGFAVNLRMFRDVIARPNVLKILKGNYVHILPCKYIFNFRIRPLKCSISQQGVTTYAMSATPTLRVS